MDNVPLKIRLQSTVFNMQCHLPVPYADELLYSVEARYAVRLGLSIKGQLSFHISGKIAKPSVFLPNALKQVAERTNLIWGKSGEDIARDLTLFPYYSRGLPTDRIARCLKKMLSDNGHGIQLLFGVSSHRIKSPQCLRYCSACHSKDMKKNGETYWRRSHQLPGVLVCPDHGKQLIDACALMNPRGYCDYIDATEATAYIKRSTTKLLNKEEHKKAFLIAQRSRDMLLGPVSGWSGENVAEVYRQAAIDRGFIEGAIKLSLFKLERSFIAYYGKRLLRLLQCNFRSKRNGSWFRKMFRLNQTKFHPLEHALVQIFLESVSTRLTDIIPFGLGPWKCPNPYGEHKEDLPIKSPLIYISFKHRKYVVSAKCKCGYHFTFQQVDKKNPKMPIVSKVMQYGPTWEAEARRIRRSGLSLLAIAKKLGVHDNNVKNMLQGKRRVDRVTQSDIKQWREEWLRLLKRVPERSRKYARNKNKGLYLRLLRNDRKWLLSEPRRWDRSTKPPRYIDWAGRDKVWSRMLREAAVEIVAFSPLKRATRTAMIKEAGLGLKILAKHDRYPKCKKTLDECSESTEAYRKRRSNQIKPADIQHST